MNEKISIIVPVYNVEKLLKKCVDSVISQTYKNMEIILVDDGSTDKSGKICDDYLKLDERIVVLHKSNGGLSSARNFGKKHSTGKYLCFIDSDDFIDDKMIEELYLNLTKYEADISMANRINYYDNGEKKVRFDNKKIQSFSKIDAIEEMNLYKYFDMSACGKIFKKELFENIEFPEGKLCEDFYIMYQILDKCDKVIYIPHVYYYYYQRRGSISKAPKINWDFVYAAKEQRNYILKKYPTLINCVNCAVSFSYLTIYDIIIDNNGVISKQDLKEIKAGAKENIKYVIKYNKISLMKKIQIILFVYFPFVYNMFYKIYKKIGK